MYLSVMSKVLGRVHDDMLSVYGFGHFPSTAILSPGGAKIAQPRGNGIDAFNAAYEEGVRKLKEEAEDIAKEEKKVFEKIKKAAEASKKAAEKAAAFKKLLEETKAKAEKGDKQAKIDMEIKEAVDQLKLSRSRRTYNEGQIALYDLFKAGKTPTLDKIKFDFYMGVVAVAISKKDKENAQKAMKALQEASKKYIEDHPKWEEGVKNNLKKLQKKVDNL